MQVYRKLGYGIFESVYQEAVEKEFENRNIPYSIQKRLNIIF